MFTGIIEEIGEIRGITDNAEGRRFRIAAKRILSDLQEGDSIAVDGVCLTAETFGTDFFEAQAVSETLSRTTLAILRRGDRVNLERAMAAGGRFGGHFVQGHVDAMAPIVALKHEGSAGTLRIAVPDSIQNYIVEKGSLTINGISLTVAEIENNEVQVALIPATLSGTNLGLKKVGDYVNLEVDILAKYIENIVGRPPKEPLTFERVKHWGFSQ